ncbi:YqeG family HAD IIIA-type phosphatase [Clostridium sp. OF09-36]|uniref:YqeG family HAD IIIA-type phosphatase n=1 Tax=Clostridium sp. OF09-36 TaxID=2292310 RepID=UPI000E4BEA10|nr:YqeG family HAD IIIA-type phosphatase [Clostridium sp. OF09-36]RHV90396.1 YqeG family HAD IIIA-type phosphatase [Clostridium sp. OF09-36]
MLEPFYPKEWLDSTYEIDWEQWKRKGIRGVLFDIDNTLVPHGAPADSRAIALFEKLHALGFQTCLLSNNKEPRVKSFADQVHSPYIYKAGKPGVKNYNQSVQEMGLCKEEVLFVGDQLFTDVYGANRAGIYGILVKPINPKEEIQIVLKRYLEAVVLYFYRKHNK